MLYLDSLYVSSLDYVDFKQCEQMLSSLHYHHIDVERSFVCEVISVLGIKEGIRAAAMRRGGLFCSTRIFYNRSLGPADRKGIRPARPAGRNRRVEKITIGTA